MNADAPPRPALLVVRPAALARRMAPVLEAAGFDCVVFPVLEIGPAPDPVALDAALAHLPECTLAAFVSPSSVDAAFSVVGHWPEGMRFAAVGEGTAMALREHGAERVIAPAGRGDAQALLELPELIALGTPRAIVFRGAQGSGRLAAGLREAGREVHEAVCYSSSPARPDAEPVLRLLQAGRLHGIVAGSSRTLRALRDAVGPDALALLDRLAVFVPHQRVADAAKALGWAVAEVAGPGDARLASGMQSFFAKV